MGKLATIRVAIEGNSTKLVKAMKKAEARTQKFKKLATKSFVGITSAAKKLATGGALALAGFATVAIKNFLDVGEQLDKMSKKTGLSVEALGELKFAAEQSGASIDTIEKAAKRMASTIFDASRGTLESVEALTALGLTADDLAGKAPEAQFQLLADALGGVSDASTKAALAQDIFGKSGTELLPLFAEGAEGMAALRQQARDLGIVMSGEAAAGAAGFNDSLNELKQAALGAFTGFASKLLPKLSEFARFLVSKKPEVIDFFTKIKEKATPFFLAFKSGVETIFPVIKGLFDFIVNNKPVLIAVIVAIGAAIVLSLGPVSLAVVAVVGIIALIGLFKDNMGAIRDFFIGAWELIKNAFRNAAAFIENVYRSKFGWLLPAGPLIKGLLFLRDNWRTIWGVIQGIIERVAGRIRSIISGITSSVQNALDAIQRVRDAASSVTSGISGAVKSIIPGLAEGGNVQRGGSAVVGERGPELLNLPRGAQVTPLARGGGGRTTTVNLNFYGDVLTNEDFKEVVNTAVLELQRRGN